MTTTASDANSSNELQRDDGLLPSFIVKRKDGVFVIPARVPPESNFQVFVERLFGRGARFTGLNYDYFQRLLYFADSTKWPTPEIRLAAEIVIFSPARKSLYHEVRVLEQGARAEYMFEPVFLEVSQQEPIYGDADATGQRPVTGYQTKTTSVPATLDFDEFVVQMWLKGVRFGLQPKAIQAAIASNRVDRVIVALQLPATPGRDAQLHEECEGLHRDDSPMIKASGQADLRRFKNRFPQIAKGQRMMKKVPCVLGKPGFNVLGEILEPEVPKDLDMTVLSGPGTRIERIQKDEYIVATNDGFLSIDVDSNQISVTEKIENRGGISAKTTGDLSLTVDEFVEHGEVQEGRIVEGHHMKFTSAVYGILESKGGRIELESNLSGGEARSPGGQIRIQRRASNATIEAPGGSVEVQYAENCRIIATTVTVEQAINCILIADALHVTTAQGCTIAAKSVTLDKSGDRRDTETMVSILLPDTSDFQKRSAIMAKELEECTAQIKTRAETISKINANPDFARFLSLKDMLRKGTLKLSSEQQQHLRQMALKYSPTSQLLERLSAEQKTLLQSFQSKQEALDRFKKEQQAQTQGRDCKIVTVIGDTYVRQLLTSLGPHQYAAMSSKELEHQLRERGPVAQRLFSDSSGTLNWHY